ncbi:MAG TPA: M1 family aminopeptidase [Steroidobacteraceae bacterium]|jgi:aminopeptidase N|nr:M1 family aminopeptidase [Steroidobacteraceae bacterium]
MKVRQLAISVLRLVALAMIGPLQSAQAAAAPDRIVLPDSVTPAHYDLEVTPDMAHLSFRGHVRIAVEVARPTQTIVLNAADLIFERVTLSGRTTRPEITLDSAQQTATFNFGAPITPGRYDLAIDYRGRIYQQASGLFALDYAGAGGASDRALFTQFENSDARRFLPCWDEPGRKATFTLTATVPAGETAVSNMPIANTENLAAGLKRVHFGPTPRMSSYLLFFGAGDFERVQRMIGNVDVGVIVKRGDAQRGRYALDIAAQLLPYYNDYFGTPYPLPKLDLIAAPGSSQFFGAMENWGAILYFEQDLLIDERFSTEGDRQNVAVVIAHEMAHQWFGDLVTMAWWDDLWLNEGFASWMETKAVDHFHPQWKLWLQTQPAVQEAMDVDAANGTHSIVTPIRDVLQASNAFDEITYQKGGAVIRMLEAYVGEDEFRAGVRRYMHDHAYGNTVTDDLWADIDAVSPKKVGDIAHDFTLHAGVPLIAVQAAQCAQGQFAVELRQSRFAIDDSASKGAQIWHVPVALQALGSTAVSHVIVAGPTVTRTALAGCGPALLNVGQSGYFRSRYAPEAYARLADHFQTLAAQDQLGLLNDTKALAFAGQAPMAQFLLLTTRLPLTGEPVIWSNLADSLIGLDKRYAGRPGRGAFRAYARTVLQPALARVGWDARAGEADNVESLRATLLAAMGRFGDPAVVGEAQRRFSKFMAAPSRVTAAERNSVLEVVAANADGHAWEKLHTLARAAPTELEKLQYYRLLGEAADPHLAQRALDLALTQEASVTLRPLIISAVAADHPELAAKFAIAHWDAIDPILESDSKTQYVPRLASSSSDPRMITGLNEFAAGHIPASAASSLEKAIAHIRYNVQIVDHLSDIDQWIGTMLRPEGVAPSAAMHAR